MPGWPIDNPPTSDDIGLYVSRRDVVVDHVSRDGYHHPVRAGGFRPLWAGVRFFIGYYAIVFLVLFLSLAIGAPAWVAGALTFVGLLGLAAFIVLQPLRRRAPPR